MADARKFDERLNICELPEVRLPGIAPQTEVGAAALTLDFDQASLLQLLDVMGDGGRADVLLLLQTAAIHGWPASDLLQHGETAWLGDGPGDGLELFRG